MSYETQLSCPVNRAVAAIADKWKILLIIVLQQRTWRFNELLHALEGIAPKVMVRQLRSMEADGLVVRTVFAEIPPRVEYALTPAGRSLLPIFNALQRWVIENSAQLPPTITGSHPERFGDVDSPQPAQLQDRQLGERKEVRRKTQGSAAQNARLIPARD